MSMTEAAVSEQSRVSFGGVLRAEWIKARSLRATWWLSASAIVATSVITAFWTAAAVPEATQENVLSAVSSGFFSWQIFLILLGSVLSTADYENHAISVFIAAVPRRSPLVLAKMLLSALLGLLVAAVATLLAFSLSLALHGGGTSITDPGVLRVLAETIVFGACIATISTAAGFLFRSTIATFGVTVSFLYIVPIVIGLVPLDAFALFSDTFPGNASTNFFATAVDPARLDPVAGMIATFAWTAAWVAVASTWITRRNA